MRWYCLLEQCYLAWSESLPDAVNDLNISRMAVCVQHNMPPPRPRMHTAAHLQSIAYTRYACGDQHALHHEYS